MFYLSSIIWRLPSLFLLCISLLPVSPLRAELPETIQRVKQSIVAVGTFQPTGSPQSRFRGTGFVVGDGRHVITNAHVLPSEVDSRKKETLAVFSRKQGKVSGRNAKVVACDKRHDLCLLSIAGKRLPALQLGQDSQVKEGALYAFTGFPIGMVLGLHPVTHRGIVSAITPIAIPSASSKNLSVKMLRAQSRPYDVFQLDATAYPGNSGSPLYDIDNARVVGVLNSVLVKSTKESALENPTGISYAIPVRYVKKLMKKANL